MKEKHGKYFIGDNTIPGKRVGINHFSVAEVFHALVTMSWLRFFLFICITYLFLAFAFTFAFFLAGPENLIGLHDGETLEKLKQIFYFSAQTLSTVGGQGIVPVGDISNLMLTMESMVALLGMALITGLLYSRFSRPSAKIVFSEKALISPYQNGKGFMVRIANAKKNELVELTAEMYFIAMDRKTKKRIFTILPLELDHIPFVSYSWTLVHRIDEKSPFNTINWEGTGDMICDVVVWLKGIDRITGQNVYSGISFSPREIANNARFLPCYDVNDEGETLTYLDKIGDFEIVN